MKPSGCLNMKINKISYPVAVLEFKPIMVTSNRMSNSVRIYYVSTITLAISDGTNGKVLLLYKAENKP